MKPLCCRGPGICFEPQQSKIDVFADLRIEPSQVPLRRRSDLDTIARNQPPRSPIKSRNGILLPPSASAWRASSMSWRSISSCVRTSRSRRSSIGTTAAMPLPRRDNTIRSLAFAARLTMSTHSDFALDTVSRVISLVSSFPRLACQLARQRTILAGVLISHLIPIRHRDSR
jgi:hypothetical protein